MYGNILDGLDNEKNFGWTICIEKFRTGQMYGKIPNELDSEKGPRWNRYKQMLWMGPKKKMKCLPTQGSMSRLNKKGEATNLGLE